MKYVPMFSNILVRELKSAIDSPIVIEPSAADKIRGEVVEIGPGEPRENNSRSPMEVRPQMIVHFFPSDAQAIDLDGEHYYLLNLRDILVIEED